MSNVQNASRSSAFAAVEGDHWVESLDDGRHVLIRPLREEDRERERQFINQLSPATRHFRFLGEIKGSQPGAARSTDGHRLPAEHGLRCPGARDGELREVGISRYAACCEEGAVRMRGNHRRRLPGSGPRRRADAPSDRRGAAQRLPPDVFGGLGGQPGDARPVAHWASSASATRTTRPRSSTAWPCSPVRRAGGAGRTRAGRWPGDRRRAAMGRACRRRIAAFRCAGSLRRRTAASPARSPVAG